VREIARLTRNGVLEYDLEYALCTVAFEIFFQTKIQLSRAKERDAQNEKNANPRDASKG